QILDGIRDAVGKPRLLHLGIRGDPDHAAGPRRGAADKGGLLDHEHAQAFGSSNSGRRHAAGTGADDNDIVGLLGRHHAARVWKRGMTPPYPARALTASAGVSARSDRYRTPSA